MKLQCSLTNCLVTSIDNGTLVGRHCLVTRMAWRQTRSLIFLAALSQSVCKQWGPCNIIAATVYISKLSSHIYYQCLPLADNALKHMHTYMQKDIKLNLKRHINTQTNREVQTGTDIHTDRQTGTWTPLPLFASFLQVLEDHSVQSWFHCVTSGAPLMNLSHSGAM